MALSARQAVEIFHLQFLRLLTAGPDRRHFTLKGGINLRFFFKSVRYSEDLDLDVAVVAKSTLKNKVDRLLESPSLAAMLKAKAMTIAEVTSPKQTETTQRWKIAFGLEGLDTPLRTKVELSRRPAAGESRFEATDRELARAYGLTAPLVNHYTGPTALIQKLRALAGRTAPQARDVLDAHWLMAQVGADPSVDDDTRKLLPRALDNTLGISFGDYRGQVVAYLEPAQQHILGSRGQWDEMQTAVVDLIERLAAS